MKGRWVAAIVVWGVLILAIEVSAVGKFVNVALLGLIFAALLMAVIYKLILMFRCRHDPEKREAVMSSGQIYPSRIMEWLMKD